jgi:hypothetical protein
VADANYAAMKALISGVGSSLKTLSTLGETGTKTEVDKTPAVMAALKSLEGRRVLVGFPRETANRDDGELSNPSRAYILNYGAPESNIPARPFMEPGIVAARDKIERYFRGAADSVMAGKPEAAEKGLNAAGLTAVASIKDKINSNLPPPLAARTIAERKARGVTRTNTLVDTGEMRNAVTYLVEKE